jgi:hypothetical protein
MLIPAEVVSVGGSPYLKKSGSQRPFVARMTILATDFNIDITAPSSGR